MKSLERKGARTEMFAVEETLGNKTQRSGLDKWRN